MKKVLKQSFFLVILIFILVLPYFIFAQPAFTADDSIGTPLEGLEKVGVESGPFAEANEFTFSSFLGTVVAALLSFLGIIFIGLMIYAGYNWMTAHGEEDKVQRAKDTIKNSIIGLVVVISSYIVWEFIVERLFL